MDLPPVLHYEVSPHSSASNVNDMTVILQVAYDGDTSILPVTNLILKARNSVLIPHLNSIRLTLLHKARKYVGCSNMTDVLIKCLRNTLKQFRREYAKYSTIMNDEIILNMIFKYVSIDMVVETLPLVSKSWYKVSKSDLLWYTLYDRYFPSEACQIERILTGPWKSLFLARDYENTNRLLYETGWRILMVHRRIGTADVWGEEAAWQDSLLQSILTTCGNGPKGTFTKSPISVGRSNKFFMDEADPGGEHEGTINEWRYGWNKACHFKCYSIEASKRILGSYIQARIRRFEQTCPYVGNFLGIFCYKASYAEFEKYVLLRATRGLQIVSDGIQAYPRIRSILTKKSVKLRKMGSSSATLDLQSKNCLFLEPFSVSNTSKYCASMMPLSFSSAEELYCELWVLYFYE
jgi:hypothetical protein